MRKAKLLLFRLLKILFVYTFAEEDNVLFNCIVTDCMINAMPWLRNLGTEYYFLFLALILIAIIICVKYVDAG